ncbi:voltage-dependent calcium channel subunit alpha-2/delta-3-like, partial [Cimex lectularius]|uniref:VWFA domain-containing protein n=1 Tax=Cimex lectularius TaxID=79782 RepID=A0A8I6SL32_CIMLE
NATVLYILGEDIRRALRWSEGLDNVFQQNYLADPTISWQYFGSPTGALRLYPALHWRKPRHPDHVDTFDCRTRFWYIEAATCSKDVVILLDNSGSMYGMRNTIAKLTVSKILDTFSNKDFINIVIFNTTVMEVVPCFPTDTLVQATPENIMTFKRSLDKIEPEGKGDFPGAFEFAFKLLAKVRENKTCEEGVCNQAIMLITDSIPENFTLVFEKYNWFDNRTRIPVRVFTYLIGLEVMNKREIKYMACMNRGYNVHIKSLEEVGSQVLKYIPVIARPMVLQEVEHPLTWTHMFTDGAGDPDEDDDLENDVSEKIQYRFMTSVSGPAYDRANLKNNESIQASLLGIAGTDVLISDIKGLTVPYKIGANGYAFLITNNGYLMFHPDLRPLHNGLKKRNYNSVDLTEVEFLDDDNPVARDPSPEILELREAMVTETEGSRFGLKIKFHYDKKRRVGVETRNYFFAALNNTPFTMGLVLPYSYGNHWIKAGDEIMKSQQMGIPLINHFKGNWRIHPEWIYCDYHRTKLVFSSSEDKLVHFLKMMSNPNWVWKEKYSNEEEYSIYNCTRPEVKEGEYYCDKELLQLLVFDAKVTEGSYRSTIWAAKNRREEELAANFGASLRFVATQSGLTRWQNIPDPIDDNDKSFGNEHKMALDEVWYKSAVLHHQLDPEAFVFSVPFESGETENLTVTASYAIFPRDGGNEAPGSVVGLHIQHKALLKRFMSITSNSKQCPNCPTCSSDEIDCYIIDGNGYIIVSETLNDTGRFFGDVEGAIMEAMEAKDIFRKIDIFNYQGVYYFPVESSSGVDILWTPFKVVFLLMKYFIGNLIWTLLENSLFYKVQAEFDDYDYYSELEYIPVDTFKEDIPEQFHTRLKDEKPRFTREPCDEKGQLYLLQQLHKVGYHSVESANCSRPFHVKRIHHTNLLLIVVDALYQSCYRKVSAKMTKIEYNESVSLSCQKLNLNTLPRRRLSGCFNAHPLEAFINDCGNTGLSIHSSSCLLITLLLLVFHDNFYAFIVDQMLN